MDIAKIAVLKQNDATRANRKLEAVIITNKKSEKASDKIIEDLKMFNKFCNLISSSTTIMSNGKPSFTEMDTKDLIFISKTYMNAIPTEINGLKSKKDVCSFISNYLLTTEGSVDALNLRNRLL